MAARGWTTAALRAALAALLVAAPAPHGAAQAADSSELWPQASLFIGLTPQTRLYLDAAYAHGKESETTTADLSAFVDYSIMPILREQLLTEDWQRSRFLWTRVGYTRVHKVNAGSPGVPEDRLSAALLAKAPLPAEVWVEARLRADLRWIGGDPSQRYRLRVEATRAFTVREHIVVPYANAEAFYDTRHSGWARSLYNAGVEVTLGPHFRYEIYLSRQNDRLPAPPESLNALGLVLKWYY